MTRALLAAMLLTTASCVADRDFFPGDEEFFELDGGIDASLDGGESGDTGAPDADGGPTPPKPEHAVKENPKDCRECHQSAHPGKELQSPSSCLSCHSPR